MRGNVNVEVNDALFLECYGRINGLSLVNVRCSRGLFCVHYDFN
jgi:hypothetical protein